MKNVSTRKVRKLFDLPNQYDVYGRWLKENGFTLKDLPLVAKNEFDENVLIEADLEEDGKTIIWKISTLQLNGWMRINYCHSDGTIEEMYDK